MRKLDTDIAPNFAFEEARKETPAMGQVLAIVPLALGAGFVVLVGGLLICWGFKVPAYGALAIAGAVMIAAILFLFWRVIVHELYMAVEIITGQDINRDGYVGAPPQLAVETHINERQITFADLPGPPQAILAWSRAAIADQSLAYENWSPLFGEYTTPMGKKVNLYRAFRQACTKHGYLVERGTHSCSLTDEGRAYFEGLAVKSPADMTPLLAE